MYKNELDEIEKELTLVDNNGLKSMQKRLKDLEEEEKKLDKQLENVEQKDKESYKMFEELEGRKDVI